MDTRSAPTPNFDELIEESLVGVYIVQDGRLVYANAKMAELFGRPLSELFSIPSVFDLLAEEDRAMVARALRQRLGGEVQTVRYTIRGLRPDGSTVELEVLSRRTEYEGRPAVSGTMLDVTEQRQAHRVLEARARRLRELFDLAQDIVVACGADRRVTALNRAGERLLGIQADDAEGRDLLEVLGAEGGDEATAAVDVAWSQGREARLELTVVTRGGATLTLEISLSPREDGRTAERLLVARDVTARRQKEQQLLSLSLVDELTGLYNRRGFTTLAERHLKLAVRKRQPFFLLFCDLDGLKTINDTWGHREGDRALADAAEILRRCFRSADIIARFGGDEFVVFPIEAADESGGILVRRLEDTMRAHNETAGRAYTIWMSVGISRFEAGSPWSIEGLLVEADRALYRQKRLRTKSPADPSSA